jgi:hypothetical protein
MKLHRNLNSGIKFAMALSTGGALTLYNRYTTSLYVFQEMGQLPDEGLEIERKKILLESYVLDYVIFSRGIQEEYEESLLDDQYKYKEFF